MSYYKEYKKLDLNLVQSEVLDFWEKESVFQKSMDNNKNNNPFVFYEGPPSANGLPGIHHVMGRTIKDLFCRYKSLSGFYVKRRAGWDTHGLPVELAVEKKLGITKEDIGDKISVSDYNHECKKSVMKYTNTWNDLTKKMGYWVDMENPYVTYEPKYIESVWNLIESLYKKNLIYKGYTIQPYSPAAGTGLSSHELNLPGCYKSVKDTSVIALFELKAEGGREFKTDLPIYFLAWTTTPWTLPANTGLAVGKKINYLVVETFNPYSGKKIAVICAEDRLLSFFKKENLTKTLQEEAFNPKELKYNVTMSLLGEELIGLGYKQLLNFCEPFFGKENAFVVVGGDFVNTDDGTGIVHMAPTFGADDKRVAEENNIPPMLVLNKENKPVPIVNEQGRYVSSLTKFAGRFVKKEFDNDKKNESLDVDIAVLLKKSGKAFRVEKYEHNYPHCWRTDKPILYYPLSSWFVKTTKHKDALLKFNDKINWYPASTGEGRFKNWLKNLNDWNLSRSRFWGTPLPIWKTENGSDVLCVGSVKQLFLECEKSVKVGFMKKNPFAGFVVDDLSDENYKKIDLHKNVVDDIVLCSIKGEKMFKEPDVIDVWFDSGAMPYAQVHYPFENKGVIENKIEFPADFIAEGVDQTRGWFFTLHAISTMCFNSPAFKNVISNGLVLDKNGQKMSKRIGNVVDPFLLIKKYGADPVRWYMVSNSNPWENLKFDVAGIEEVSRKFFGTLYNTYSFFALYANIDGFNPPKKGLEVGCSSVLDRWISSELNSLVIVVKDSYENFDATRASREIQSFVVDKLSNWYVRLCRRRFWKNTLDSDKLSGFETLYNCLLVVSKISSPIAPFYMDSLYKDLTKKESVHLCSFPNPINNLIDLQLEKEMGVIRSVVSLGLSLRKKENIRVRQPISGVSIIVKKENIEGAVSSFSDLIKKELNVKSVRVVKNNSSLVKKSIDLNYPVLGKKHGPLVKFIKKEVASLTEKQVIDFEKEKKIHLNLNGSETILTNEDLILKTTASGDWSVVENNDVLVAIDTNITPELLGEGVCREFINRTQGLRKSIGFNVTDLVEVRFFGDNEFVKTIGLHEKYICEETLCSGLFFDESVTNNGSLVEINRFKVYIAITLSKKK